MHVTNREARVFRSNTEQVEKLQPAQCSISYQVAEAILTKSSALEIFTIWFQSSESKQNHLVSTNYRNACTKRLYVLPVLKIILKTVPSTLIVSDNLG
jgi:hypothetical protein